MISAIYDAEALEFIDSPEALVQMSNFVGHDIKVNYAKTPTLVINGIEFREGDFVVRLAGSIVKVEREAILSEGETTNPADYPQP